MNSSLQRRASARGWSGILSLQTGSGYAGCLCALLVVILCGGCGSHTSRQTAATHEVLSAHGSTAAAKPGVEAHEVKVLEQALQKKPNHVPVLLKLAGRAIQSGKSGEAERYLREAVRAEPRNIEARLELGRVLFDSGKVVESVQVTEEILKTQPGNPDALYNLGAINGNVGNRQRALDYWQKLLASHPESESGRRAKEMMARLQSSP